MKGSTNVMTKEEMRRKVKEVFLIEPELKLIENGDPDQPVTEPYAINVKLPGSMQPDRSYNHVSIYGRGETWHAAWDDLMSCLTREQRTAREDVEVSNRSCGLNMARLEWLSDVVNRTSAMGER